MCGKPGKGRHGTSHHAKAIYIKYKIISSSRSWDICYESVNGRTNGWWNVAKKGKILMNDLFCWGKVN
jgi:hypothetical protein